MPRVDARVTGTTTSVGGRRAIHRACPECGRDNAQAAPNRYSQPPWLIKQCVACDFVYIESAPVYAELLEEHSWDKTAVAHGQARKARHPLLYALSRATRWRLHLFKRRRLEEMLATYMERGRVLDIGCGRGDQLKPLAERYVPYGIEISRVEASYAEAFVKARNGEVIVRPATDGLASMPAEFVDAVFMRSYLEHEADPGGVVAGVARVLRPGGIAIIKVPNYGCLNRRVLGNHWSGFRLPDHLNYFTPASLVRMCCNRGLTVRRFGWRDHLAINDNMWLIAGKAPAGGAERA